MSETLALLALSGAVIGAVGKTIQSKLESEQPYSFKKLAGALIGSALFSLTVVNLANIPDQVSTVGTIGIFILNAVAGAGISSILSKANKSSSDDE